MSVGLGLAIYFVIWWTVLFAVLPWGVRSQTEAGETSPGDPGAPARAHLPAKFLATTLISLIAFGLVYWLVASRG